MCYNAIILYLYYCTVSIVKKKGIKTNPDYSPTDLCTARSRTNPIGEQTQREFQNVRPPYTLTLASTTHKMPCRKTKLSEEGNKIRRQRHVYYPWRSPRKFVRLPKDPSTRIPKTSSPRHRTLSRLPLADFTRSKHADYTQRLYGNEYYYIRTPLQHDRRTPPNIFR